MMHELVPFRILLDLGATVTRKEISHFKEESKFYYVDN
jgi:hypothetical protein